MFSKKNFRLFEYLIILILVIFCGNSLVFAQGNIYNFFGKNKELIFLKNIEKKIINAQNTKNATSLCAYSALLFYAQHLTGKEHEEMNGVRLLREATYIAWKNNSIFQLEAVKAVWGSKFFGANDPVSAKAVEKQIVKIKREMAEKEKDKNETLIEIEIEAEPEKHKEPKQDYDPQKVLQAEEYARVDALAQIAEQIFGVALYSVTDVKNFETKHDLVVAKLKSNLLTGAKFGEMQIQGGEVTVPVTIKKKWIIIAMKQSLLNRKKGINKFELEKFEKSLKPEYKAVGMGIIGD